MTRIVLCLGVRERAQTPLDLYLIVDGGRQGRQRRSEGVSMGGRARLASQRAPEGRNSRGPGTQAPGPESQDPEFQEPRRGGISWRESGTNPNANRRVYLALAKALPDGAFRRQAVGFKAACARTGGERRDFAGVARSRRTTAKAPRCRRRSRSPGIVTEAFPVSHQQDSLRDGGCKSLQYKGFR